MTNLAFIYSGLMIGCAVTSVVASIFDVKHSLHLQVRLCNSHSSIFFDKRDLQLVPHLSRYHQVRQQLTHIQLS